MIEQLFGSKARLKILKLFLLYPEKRFYIRQVARDLKLQLNSARRELENLEKFGLLVSEYSQELPGGEGGAKDKRSRMVNLSRQEKKYYRANTDFVLFEEIKALIVKAQILYEKDFIAKLAKAGKPRLLILTGLFANNPNSLVDLLIVGKFNKAKLSRLIRELGSQLGKEINFTHFNQAEFNYRKNITDVFLYDILESRKIVVINELDLS